MYGDGGIDSGEGRETVLRVGYLTSQLRGPSLSSLPAALPTVDFNSGHTRLPVLPQICTHFLKFF